MKRAAILIGVESSGGLPTLKDAIHGAHQMEQWAIAQGMDTELITDENQPVEIGDIKKAVKKIVDAGNVEQLLIYFAGHGVNIRYGEYWLLSDAPNDTQAAVNLYGSEVLARYSGIPHVIFVSDACRTAASGIQAQFVTGGEIFPNSGAGNLEKPVDQFFACTLGRPAHEVQDPNTTSNEYSALYTNELVDALSGKHSKLIQWTTQGNGIIQPRPLKRHMITAISKRILGLHLQTELIQVPDARITSGDKAWVAKLQQAPSPAQPPLPQSTPSTPANMGASLLHSVLYESSAQLHDDLKKASHSYMPEGAEFAKSVAESNQPFGPMHHETGCGFKVRGAHIVDVYARYAQVELLTFERPGEAVRIDTIDRPGASVVLEFDKGYGAVLPAIPGYLGALTIEDGELVDVAYEPSDNTGMWGIYKDQAEGIRTLRGIASASTRNGVFRLEGDDVMAVAKQMQYAKGIDPTLGIYAAYAYHDMQRRDLIKKMSNFMRDGIGAPLFDIALLSRILDNRPVGTGGGADTFGFMPLLVQGWALLSAFQVDLPDSLSEIQQTLLPSVWSLFNSEGLNQIRQAIEKGEVV